MIAFLTATFGSYNNAMARSSPGVRRMIAILDFFADHPDQSFTLTDLVRALRLNRATCHALLAGLVDSGYLYRTHDKSYVIGPRLVAIGRIANEHFSPLQVAQPEMRALADEFSVICSAFFPDRDEVVVRARAASLSHLGFSIPQGARMKLRPPFGAVYYAWSTREEVRAWLDQVSPPPTAEQSAQMMRAIEFGRTHGFLFGARNPNIPQFAEPPEQVFIGQRAEYPVTVESEVDAARQYQLAFVAAPVFDSRGQVAFALGLQGFMGTVSGAMIEHMGHTLRAACDRITTFAGRQPQMPIS
jgi:DNA-binding IclR family transcriptional regulator